MGRPKKYEAILSEYYTISHTKAGKCTSFTCNYCKASFAKNFYRMAGHLLCCKKTDQTFETERWKLTKLIEETNKEKKTEKLELSSRLESNNFSSSDSEDGSSSAVTCATPTSINSEIRNSAASTSKFIHNVSQPQTAQISETPKATRTFTPASSRSSQKNLFSFVDRMINADEKEEIWTLLARACYATGTPLNFTQNSYWQQLFKKIRPSLELPTRHILSSSLLNEEHTRVKNLVSSKIQASKYISIQLDGWSNIRQESIVNVIITCPEPVVYKIIDTQHSICLRL